MTPNYKLKIEIVDSVNDVAVGWASDPMYSFEDNIATLSRAIRDFDKKREEHESTYYPKEEV